MNDNIIKHPNHEELVSNLKIRENTLIIGPTASGKTKGVQLAAEELGLPFYLKVVGNQSTEASIMGYNNANGVYVEGIAYKPFVEGGVLLIDEIDNGNPNVNLTLNALADRKVSFPCGMRDAHPNFVLVATANTVYGATLEYCGRNRQDVALTNRFVFMKWDYDKKLELQIAYAEYHKHNPNNNELAIKVVPTVVDEIHKFRESIKVLKINHIISPRTTLQAIRKLATGRTKKEVLNSIILKAVDVDTAKKLLNHVGDVTLVQETIESEIADLYRRYPTRFNPIIDKVQENLNKADKAKQPSVGEMTGLYQQKEQDPRQPYLDKELEHYNPFDSKHKDAANKNMTEIEEIINSKGKKKKI